MDKVFYVDLVSNASMEVYPENTLAAFTNMMNSPIDLNEPYEVALNEIIYPLDFGDSMKIRYCYVSIERRPSEDLKVAIKRVHEGSVFTFKFAGPMRTKEIIAAFAEENAKNISTVRFVNGDEELRMTLEPKLEYDEEDDRVTSQAGQLSDGKTVMIFFEDDSFLAPLGFERAAYTRFFDREDVSEKHRAPHPPDFSSRSNLLFVNTDIIEGHRVGDSMSTTLRTLPLSKGVYENVQYMSFINEYYFPVRFSRIDSISIKLTDENGKRIKFKSGRVFITLKFRPRKRPNLTYIKHHD